MVSTSNVGYVLSLLRRIRDRGHDRNAASRGQIPSRVRRSERARIAIRMLFD
jgi:hypothetical protein